MTTPASTDSSTAQLPPVSPHVVAAAVESLTSRLRKKLDEAIELYAATPATAEGDTIRVSCGADAVVTLSPGPSGAVTDPDEAACSCLLAPRCLHRAAVLGACPIADADVESAPAADGGGGTSGAGSAGASPQTASSGEATGDFTSEGRPSTTGNAVGDLSNDRAGAAAVHGGFSTTHGAVPGVAAMGGGSSGAQVGAVEAAAASTDPGPATQAGLAEAAVVGAGPSTALAAAAVTAGRSTTQVAAVSAGPSGAQVAAASGLWAAAAAVLAAGVPAAGAVPQAELLRAAHTARLAGLHRAEAATLRVVRSLRAARARHDGHRLADLVSALRELLIVTRRIAAADPDPALIGIARRNYESGGSLRVYGVCREPVISATGYGGVVTHVITEDGRWFSVADVKPGGSARARGAATATVALGSAALNHAQLARGGLLVSGATVSPDGRLGAGRGVRANPVSGLPWSAGPLAGLFARPLTEAVDARLSDLDWSDSAGAERATELVGCDLVILGALGDRLLARVLPPADGSTTGELPTGSAARQALPGRSGKRVEPAAGGSPDETAGEMGALPADGLLVRLAPASSHPDLAHLANLRQLASRPGLRVRVVGRLDPDRAATLRPLAVGPVPGADPTLRLPKEWLDRADLGYDRLQGSHLPSPDACSALDAGAGADVDPVSDAPLWRVRRLVELAVTGGRRAIAESARGGDSLAQAAPLRRSGFEVAAGVAAALTSEADRRSRDVFGRLSDSGPDRYASAWLAAAVYLAATERALIQASWHTDDTS